MKTARRLALLVAIAVSAAPALAQEVVAGAPQVYLQRTADGRVLLTDRPLDGARTQRIWTIWSEDPAAARERGEKVRLEAQAVTERIQRSIELQQQRADQYELARLRLSLAEARRDADRAREAARDMPVLLLPRAVRWPLDMRAVRPPVCQGTTCRGSMQHFPESL